MPQLNANQSVGNYWIRAQPNSAGLQGYAGGINSAILRYNGAPKKDPASVQPTPAIPLNEVDLHPLVNPKAVRNLNAVSISILTQMVPYSPDALAWVTPTSRSILSLVSYVASICVKLAAYTLPDWRKVLDQQRVLRPTNGSRAAPDPQWREEP